MQYQDPDGEIWTGHFLKALEETGDVSAAAKAVERSRSTIYRHRRADPEFAAEWSDIIDRRLRNRVVDELQERSLDRAINGWPEPIIERGRVVGVRRRYSDRLQIFFLTKFVPDRYGDQVQVAVSEEEFQRRIGDFLRDAAKTVEFEVEESQENPAERTPPEDGQGAA